MNFISGIDFDVGLGFETRSMEGWRGSIGSSIRAM